MRGLLLGLLLCLAPAAAPAAWYEASGKHFVVYSNDDPKRIETFANQLERFDKAMRQVRGVADPDVPPAARVTVFVVNNDHEVDQLLPGHNAAGFYASRPSGPVAFVPRKTGATERWELDPASVLRHEYAHHFMYTTSNPSALPSWFVEGFAEFFATAIFNADDLITIGQVPGYRAYGLVAGPTLSMPALMTTDQRKLSGEVEEKMYGRGWLLVHYLAFTKSRQGQLSAYMTRLNNGESSLDAATHAFGDLKQLDRELDQQLRATQIAVITVNASALRTAPVTLRALPPGEAAMMRVRIRSQAGVNERTAPAVADQARRIAAAYPDDPGAQLALTEALYDAKDDAGAEAAVGRVLAADPKNVRALCFKGQIALRRAVAAKATDSAVWSAARKPIIAANRLDPDDPWPLELFYESFLSSGRAPTSNAIVGLEHAADMAPFAMDLRFMLAVAYLNGGKSKEARAMLTPVAFDPHPSERADRARRLLTAIDTGEKTAIDKALSAMVASRDE